MFSTATHENSASIYSLRETSNLLSMYSGGGIENQVTEAAAVNTGWPKNNALDTT